MLVFFGRDINVSDQTDFPKECMPDDKMLHLLRRKSTSVILEVSAEVQ